MKIIGVLLMVLAQSLVFVQSYFPLRYDWVDKNKWVLYLISIPITHIFIVATKICVNEFGTNWASRFIGQSVGIIIFMAFNYMFFKEGLDVKNLISLILVVIILFIQFY
tara:strand:- start:1672 stop:1998 length:327 start_codon:yes stop_codon:yes gene_type:complete